jgi:hypothetical protein
MSLEGPSTHVCHVSCCFYCVNTKIGSGSLVCFSDNLSQLNQNRRAARHRAWITKFASMTSTLSAGDRRQVEIGAAEGAEKTRMEQSRRRQRFFWRLPQFVAQIRLNLDLDHYSSQLQILA